jgi:cytochrome P450
VARGTIPVGELEATDGALILLLLAATGRDPAAFADPERFDITRDSNGRPGAGHLAFAAGPHFCLGAPLARLEAATALTAFARRAVAPELAADGLHYKPNFNLRGPDRLLIRTAGLS